MQKTQIDFFIEEVTFELGDETKLRVWLKKIAQTEEYNIGELNYIFCNDEYLHKINEEFLNHDDYTDIITFDNSEHLDILEGDIFISIERVKENAGELQIPFEKELLRVMSHGLLHLMGYEDKKPEDIAEIRAAEDKCIALYDGMA